ncbi:hypothetical protein NECAME_16129 [Necator americanus]|uniref:Neurotransmitter-gated ion-channel ligand-binding domain-containing protein n=1 Tax=Necator americanus TaxID=51031 RepID=W2TXJ8_NECAM|nr:hypothetical protein NECAME_16129 [Necator americanus]ETN86785.1 hypothetical protein NECAME_16129 [Necator americanus]
MQAKKIKYDVIGLTETRRRHPFNAIYETGKEVDVTYYPFDTQTCFLKMGSWTYSGKHINLDFMLTQIIGRSIQSNK